MGFWMDNAFQPATHTVVDLGYVAAKPTRDRADQLRKHVGARNFQLAGANRLLVRLPTRKVATILQAFPAIRPSAEAPGYCWCTHTWLDAESVDLKHAQG